MTIEQKFVAPDLEATADPPPSVRTARRPGTLRRRERAPWWVLGLGLLAGLGFVGVNLYYNGGRYIPPLDDAYIHMQYAKQIGSGHFLQYNTGDPISTGASSLLYVVLLGALYFLGVQGALFLPAAVLFGVVCHALTAAGVVVLGGRLSGRRTGIWAGVLAALSGPLLWGATSGMEVSLTALLLVAALLAFTAEAPRALFRVTPAVVALAALCRLEAFVFLAPLVLLMLVAAWRRHRPARAAGWSLWALLPIWVTGAQLLFYEAATGSSSPNGSQAKSLLSAPHFTWGEFAGGVAANAREFLSILSGLSRQDFAFPGALAVAAIGVVALAARGGVRRQVGLAMAAGMALAVLAISTMATALWQQVRYLQPFLPLFALACVVGLTSVATWLAGRAGRRAATALLGVALVFTAVSLPLWANNVGRDSESIRTRIVALATWMKGHLPPDASIGVHDVGAAAYLGGHETVDLVGLTTNGVADAAINGMGSLYEVLSGWTAQQRPDYIAIYDAMPDGIRLEELADGSVFGTTMLALPNMTVYRADWSELGSGAQPLVEVSGQLRDRLNVGSMADEEAHDHSIDPPRRNFQPATGLHTVEAGGREVVDSYRHVWGTEEFTLNGLTPGQPVELVMRHDSTEPKPGAYTGAREVRVQVDGVEIGNQLLEPHPRGWAESVITIPAERVTSDTIEIRMAPTQEYVGPYPNYRSFGYWAYQ
ncbi:hypothetical protein [Saccharopolyspora sp. CA-218241]|uniref:hypothetical protein n=1 Tax=Saccharopolyspora sp. CA-218241 TaxID=3240027 RepID=UPI003D96EB80